ncbi:MAG: hypothetical protein H7Y15_18685 [Pseudonocardia sp.]|nr:hypothetical protein [Pseudonocardia sp.]
MSTERSDAVFTLWCELTRTDPGTFGAPEFAAFRARPHVEALGDLPDAVLRDAGENVVRGRSLPLERWLGAVRAADQVRAGRTRAGQQY